MEPTQPAPGLWRWTERHPAWHPGEFGAQVACYALVAGGALLLVDPLVPDVDQGPVPALLDGLAAGRRTHVLITIGYHVRSAEALAARYDAAILGPEACRSRLSDAARFTVLTPEREGPAGVRAFAIGRPPRGEHPLWIPSHAAIAFGDAVVSTPDGELRMWCAKELDARRLRVYRERFAPTLDPLMALPAERILVTHGAAVMDDGAERLRAAVAAAPWYHPG